MPNRKKVPSTNGHKPEAVTSEHVRLLQEQFLLEESVSLDDGSESIVARVNPMVARRAEETLEIVSAKRGLKSASAINAQDSEVLGILESQTEDDPELTGLLYRGRAGKLKGTKDRKKLESLVNRAIAQVRRQYEAHENSLRFLAYTYAMIADDVFSVLKANGKIGIESRLDYTIPADYWEHGGGNIRDIGQEDATQTDPFAELLERETESQFQPEVDRTSVIEIALGVTYEVLRRNPRLASVMAELVVHLLGYLQVYDRNFEGVDDKSFRLLRARLSGLLYVRDGEPDQNGDRDESAAQLPATAEAHPVEQT